VEKLCETIKEQFVSREALALDISRIVSRLVSGEQIDTTERGAALAAKYPELGMNAELIGQAIDRAANMVGMMKTAPAPPNLPREEPQPVISRVAHVAEIERPAAPTAPVVPPVPPPVVPPRVLSIDDELAAAIDSEIGNLVAQRKPVPAGPAATFVERAEASLPDPETQTEEPVEEKIEPPVEDTLEQSWPEIERPPEAPSSKGPLAAFRRAFLRR
jgi:hypothetical protein